MKTPTLKDFKKMLQDPKVIALVNDWLLAKAYLETIEPLVNEIYSQILADFPIYNDKDNSKEQIFLVRNMYLSDNEKRCERIYEEMTIRTRAAGLRSADMYDEQCPLLVAKSLLNKATWKIVEHTGEMFNITQDKLMSNTNWDELTDKFVDLIVGAVINSPGYEKVKIPT